MRRQHKVGKALLQLIFHLPRLIQEVASAINDVDGIDTEDEAAKVARAASVAAGDVIRIRRRGDDVVSLEAQHDLAEAIGRIAYRVAGADR
jgi:hypothetical protein